jgi:hypothetical protein
MPWGHLTIAVGPDGRPMRPRVKWQLWSISQGERPRNAVVAGLASFGLGVVSLVAAEPWLLGALLRPMPWQWLAALGVIASVACLLIPLGLIVLLRGLLDLGARRSSMAGRVVGMRRDVGLIGHAYHVAVQAGDRAQLRDMWAESFKINRATFERLKPGDRLTVEYSPRLRFVYQTLPPQQRPVVGRGPAQAVDQVI